MTAGILYLRKVDDDGPGVEPAADLLVRASTALTLPGSAVYEALGTKLDGTFPVFATQADALASPGLSLGRFGVARIGGRLSLWANDDGVIVDLLTPASF